MKTRTRAPRAPRAPVATPPTRSAFQPVANVEIETVHPSEQGFMLAGHGNDRADYRIDLHFDLPLDTRTRTVLGEILAQSDLAISRRNS